MDTRILLRQLLRNPHTSRTLLTPATRPQSRTFALLFPNLILPHARHISLPTILRPSFWRDMIPKPFRERNGTDGEAKRKEWNPATPYIVLALLVGSQAIQILWLKQERALETRRAEAKIGLLREVVERVQRGESVDVEGLLGGGREESEREWAGCEYNWRGDGDRDANVRAVIKEVKEEELLFQSSEEKKRIKQARIDDQNEVAEKNDVGEEKQEEARVKVESLRGAKFY